LWHFVEIGCIVASGRNALPPASTYIGLNRRAE